MRPTTVVSAAGRDKSGATLGIIGSTGLIGSTICRSLAERPPIFSNVILADTADRAGRIITVHGIHHQVLELCPAVFEGVDVAICALPKGMAKPWIESAIASGTKIVDCSGTYSEDLDVPLIAADINLHEVTSADELFASPSSLTLSAAASLRPLHEHWEALDVNITALLPASVNGKAGMERLRAEVSALADSEGLGSRAGDVRARMLDTLDADSSPFAAPLAFNVVSWVGKPRASGISDFETGALADLPRVLGTEDLRLNVTCLQVPVLVGETLAVEVRFSRQAPADDVRGVLTNATGVVVLDDPGSHELPTPIDTVGLAPAFAGRIRQHPKMQRTVSYVQCSDNLKLGTALNAVRIAEASVSDGQAPQSH